VKLVPVITILEPLYPEVDVKDVMLGGVDANPWSLPMAI
jgi:hypothetical protein